MKRIAIIGGLGYLGLHLVDYFRRKNDFDITIYGRKNLELFIDPSDNARVEHIDTAQGNFDVVVNLAYPQSYSRKKNFAANKSIAQTLLNISRPDTCIIHTSTVAVFGVELDYPIEMKRVKMRRDIPYCELKIHMENVLLDGFKGRNLHIIRLGNVWGPGSVSWLHNVADRLTFREAFPDSAVTACSNITYVSNVCSFIHHLASSETPINSPTLHHMAEFGSITWGKIIEQLGNYLDEKPVYKAMNVITNRSLGIEIKRLISPALPRSLFYRMLEMRRLSSISATLVDIIPSRFRSVLKRSGSESISSRDVKDIVFSNPTLFPHFLNSDWKPEFSFDEAFQASVKSLKEAGYLVKD
jgi:nucleoside-diphosphate-sugar epimerase